MLTIKQVRNLLVGAFEGGSNYWYHIDEHVLSAGVTFDDFREGGKLQPPDDYYHWSQLIPTTAGCALLVGAPNSDYKYSVALNLEALRAAETIMKRNFPNHWKDVKDENDDASTADVFLQCAIFGDVIFG